MGSHILHSSPVKTMVPMKGRQKLERLGNAVPVDKEEVGVYVATL